MQQTQKADGNGWGGNAPQPVLTLRNGKPVNPWLVLFSIVFGFFMSLLDATIVNIAISDIQRELKTNLTTVSWVLNAYNLVFAVLLVTMGRFADQFGRKRVFMIGMIMFSLASLLCAVAPTVEWLIAFRAIQAIGAAALNPVSLALITVVFPPNKRGAAIGIWGALAGLAAAVGPVLGGFLVQNFGWQSIFFVNLPFCVIGLFLVYRNVPETRDTNATKNIDIPGLITLTAGMVCLVLAVIQGNDWGWTSPAVLGLFAGAVVGLVAFFLVETRLAQPILDFSLFSIRSFTSANLGIFMFSVAIQGAFLILVLFFIQAQGYDELGAAYALIPLPLASFVVSAVFSRLSGRANPRYAAMLGMLLVGLGLVSLYTLSPDSGYIDTAWRAVIIGLGMGFCFTTFPTMALSEVPRNKVGVASGAFNTCRQIGFALGVAILISLFAGQIKDNVVQARDRAVAVVKANTTLPEAVRGQIATNLQNTDLSQAGGRGSSNASQFDLTALADRIPNGQALKPQLAELNTKISAEFKTATVDAFRVTWFAAGMIALFGIIPTFFTGSVRPQPAHAPTKKGEDAPVMIDMA